MDEQSAEKRVESTSFLFSQSWKQFVQNVRFFGITSLEVFVSIKTKIQKNILLQKSVVFILAYNTSKYFTICVSKIYEYKGIKKILKDSQNSFNNNMLLGVCFD